MKSPLVWVVMAACLVSGCATRPASESEVLASRIARERPSMLSCAIGDVRYCEIDGDGETHCDCVDRRALSGGR
jgi:outer membrane lipoprotein SlyB